MRIPHDIEVRHPHVPNPFDDLNDRVADKISTAFGSMGMFWGLVIWMFAWMILAEGGIWLFGSDAYPFPFLLFLSNLVQLWALPVLGTTQNRADAKRNAKADADHQALTYIATRLDALHGRMDEKEEAPAG